MNVRLSIRDHLQFVQHVKARDIYQIECERDENREFQIPCKNRHQSQHVNKPIIAHQLLHASQITAMMPLEQPTWFNCRVCWRFVCIEQADTDARLLKVVSAICFALHARENECFQAFDPVWYVHNTGVTEKTVFCIAGALDMVINGPTHHIIKYCRQGIARQFK